MEITAPGGDLEKIRYAVLYGADAVYCGFNEFGLRAAATNLSYSEIHEAIAYCHKHGVRLYLTLNAYLRNQDLGRLSEFVQWLSKTEIDAVIVSDPGVFELVQTQSNIPIHISTQSNVTNAPTARFWHSLGAKRIVPSRELSFREICEIQELVPSLEIECFIHGAMCVAYSGRCLLSAYLNQRSANSGACTHPCRWDWAITEQSRPGEYFPIEEDQYGTHLLSSKDLCLLKKMPILDAAGVHAGKIEGRMKSLYYVAQTTRLYKAALNTPEDDVSNWERLFMEINKVSHRPYWEGFYEFESQDSGIVSKEMNTSDYQREWQYCGKVVDVQDGLLWFDSLSKVCVGDAIELIYPDLSQDVELVVKRIYDEDRNIVPNTKPNFRYGIEISTEMPEGGIVRKCVSTS